MLFHVSPIDRQKINKIKTYLMFHSNFSVTIFHFIFQTHSERKLNYTNNFRQIHITAKPMLFKVYHIFITTNGPFENFFETLPRLLNVFWTNCVSFIRVFPYQGSNLSINNFTIILNLFFLEKNINLDKKMEASISVL